MQLRRPFVAFALTLAACGGSRGGDAVDPKRAGPPAPADEEHVVAELAIEGIRFTPGALGYPSMHQVTRGKTSLAAARKKLARRPTLTDVQLFASLAWAEAARLGDSAPDQAGALREEARAALEQSRAAAGDKVDPVTLQMSATAAMWLGDAATATAIYEQLLARFPGHEGAASFRTWLASLYLQQDRLGDARTLVADWKPADVPELQAYVQAWVAFAARDYPLARSAIASAASRWKDPATRPGVDRDLVLILARGDGEPTEAVAAIGAATGGDAQARKVLVARLADAYKFAGAFARAAASLDVLAEGATPEELVVIRFQQADFHFRLNQPARAAERAIEAHGALAACGAPCAGETAEAVTGRVAKLAQFSHGVFATTQDPAHAEAARTLYTAYLAIPGRADAETVQSYLKNLEDTRANAPAGQGKHGDKLAGDLVLVRREALAACYEAVLVAEPALSGAIKLSIAVSSQGEVTGAATDPAGGQEGLAAVARCLDQRVRTWSFPARSLPGETRIHVPITVAPRAEARR
jgi:hypothetical protein